MMRLKRLVLGVSGAMLLASALPAAANAQLWYNGNFDGNNGLSSERNTAITQSMTYDNFVVTGAGWTLTSVFGEFLTDIQFTTADYEIRSGVSSGNGGSLLFSGTGVGAAGAATGRNGYGYDEYRATISGLNIFLAPGTYWLGISLYGNGVNGTRAFVSTTSGTNGVNSNLDGNYFFNSSFFSANFAPNYLGSGDYAYGVDGMDGGNGVVPEPATMTLLATGLAGMAAARRRKKTTA